MTTRVAQTRFDSPDELLSAVGRDLGTTPWMSVDPASADQFDRATEHASEARDRVPPLLLLSLTNHFLPQLLEVGGISSGVNYGANSVRFGTAAARTGDRLRAIATVIDAAEVPGGVQTTIRIVVEVEGAPEPACVVDSLSRWLR